MVSSKTIMTRLFSISLAVALTIASGLDAQVSAETIESRTAKVLTSFQAGACDALARAEKMGIEKAANSLPVPRDAALRRSMANHCSESERVRGQAESRGLTFEPLPEGTPPPSIPDGTILGSQQLMAASGVVVDLIAYSSSNLVVAGVLCYRDDGMRRSAVLHQHGGYGGIFINADGNMLETCLNWALLHNRTAFAPSYRGQDGGEGQLEICLGEADDVAAAAILLRSLPFVVPERLALIGGSVGGCVTMQAAAKIPLLRAVVALVPPIDWKALVNYHRLGFVQASETNCDGSTTVWDQGGEEIADFIDIVMCGQIGCPDAAYDIRSPLTHVTRQSAPTMIVVAGSDNLVPTVQQMLWSIQRQNAGNFVQVVSASKCDPPLIPQLVPDLLLFVDDGYHGLAAGPVGSGFLFLMNALDQGSTPGTAAPRD